MVRTGSGAASGSSGLREALLFFSTYLFPIVGFPLVSYAWWRTSGGSWPLTIVVMGVPVIFGYLMPAVATHVVKRWRFTSGPRLGSYYVHHGFIYASKLAFVLLLVVRSLDEIASAFDAAAVVVIAGAATAFGGWFHDAQALRAGKIEMAGGGETLSTFAPQSYFAMGATYAGVTLAASRILSASPEAVAWVFPASLILMCVIPTAVFLAVDPISRVALVNQMRRRSKTEVRT
ncbi:MAG TPA: hypothetical protein VFO19_06110 [Vicinamibacterales bacterium]|nr:hypothetical protein [Vicinamibacterales bacterium]